MEIQCKFAKNICQNCMIYKAKPSKAAHISYLYSHAMEGAVCGNLSSPQRRLGDSGENL